MNPQFKLEKLDLWRCSITEKQCLILTSALKSNPSHLRELNLSGNKLGDSGVKNLSDLLMNPQFKLETLDLYDCSITEKQCLILILALKSNPSHLRELNLSENKLGDSGVKNLSDLLMNPQFKLETIELDRCSITEKQCLILTSALKSNPSHLTELYLSWNKLGDSGVKNLSDLLMNPQFKLEKLDLKDCGITDVSSLTQSLTNTKALQFLKELDLRNNMIGDSKQRLIDVLRDSNCKLRLRKAQLPPPILTTFYRGTIESTLSSCITVWFGNCTISGRKTLQRIVRTAEKIIGVSLPSIEDIYTTRCIRKATSIVADRTHPSHSLFTLLPSGKRFVEDVA
ncbi:ribonuclease inhibitor-like [Garra rufa]|uniref:ribonuclease inhibitor-like n=1 Tax=Garra rufa TaxID=137080 RepID=UPI003CCEC943